MRVLIIRYKHPHLKSIMEYASGHLQKIREIIPEAVIDVVDADKNKVERLIGQTEILIMSPLDHSEIVDFDKASNLKWVHLTGAGVGDIANRLKSTSVLLTNSSGVHPINIAEQVFTYMLMFARQLVRSYRNQLLVHKWVQDDIASNLCELNQSSIAIVGFGRIGKRVAKIAHGFDMKVLATSRSGRSEGDGVVDEYYGADRIGEMLARADFVIDCLPLTDETKAFFDWRKFSRMKPTAYFVNIGRGLTVVEADLIKALKQGVIRGAGMDVFAEEPLPDTSELWQMDNVIITPHYAGWTPRYIDRVVEVFCENLRAYLESTKMPTLVDKVRGY